MATLTGGTLVALDTRDLGITPLLRGSLNTQTTTTVDFDEGAGQVGHFIGTGFVFDLLGRPGAGNINEISEDRFGQTLFHVGGLDLNMLLFDGWSIAQQNTLAVTTIFAGDDMMSGTAFGDYLEGFNGHDNISGESGADTLLGGAGNDHLYGYAATTGGIDGADSLLGGDGSDYLQGNKGNDTLDGGNGSDRINGGADDDHITGGTGNDTVNGNLGNDVIDGGDGNDLLRGGQGDDGIDGGAGNDVLLGDKGIDVLTGGAGIDLFQFNPGDAAISGNTTDLITDFTPGTDHIGLGFVPAALLAGGSATDFAAAQTAAQPLLDQHAGDHEVAIFQVGNDTYLFWNGSGGAAIDSAVDLHNVTATAITLADFV